MKRFSKAVLLVLLSIVSVSTCSVTAKGFETANSSNVDEQEVKQTQYKVLKDNTIIKEEPTQYSAKLGTLKKDTIITPIERVGNWYKINYNSGIGYVHFRKVKEAVQEVKGSVTVQYVEAYSGKIISEDVFSDLKLTTHTFEPKVIDGYAVDDIESKSVTLSENYPNKTIKFEYMPNFNPDITSDKTKGVFSWKNTIILEENKVDTYNWIDKLQLNEIYQSSLFRLSQEEREKFISDLNNDKNVEVYSLTGDPRYFNDLSDYIRKIDQVKNHNDNAPVDARFKGIVFDVEPWALGDGNWTQEEYANVAKQAYEYSKSVGVEFVMVIPFWLEENISEIIIQNSDKTIVMNYNIAAPIKFIKEEITWAKKYNKPISTAAETQDIDPRTTYYNIGVDRMIHDWMGMDLTYDYDGLEYSLHHFESVKDFIK